MRHIKNYSKAKAILKDWEDRLTREAEARLKKDESTYGNKDCWDEDFKCYRHPSPDRCLCTAENVEDSRKYLTVTVPRLIKSYEDRLAAADNAGRLIELEITVNWTRDAEFGCLSPRAIVWLTREDPKYGSFITRNTGDKIGGCGYDKRSAAVSDALVFELKKRDGAARKAEKTAALASLDRFVIEHGEELWKEYGIEKAPFPHLSFNAKGMSCFTGLFKRIGTNWEGMSVKDYVIDYREPEKGADFYHVIRRDKI